MILDDPQAQRLAKLAAMPSVVMCVEDRESLMAGARALEREARERRSRDDTRETCLHREWFTTNPPRCVACGKVGT